MPPTAPEPGPPVVHLVAKTHLDVGFTATEAEVVDTYVESYIPAALALGAELRARGGPERFVWTTGSWIIDTYLERTDAAGRAAAEAAIEAGDLAWLAVPFTLHTELCDPALVEAGLEVAARLDHRFGRRTVAAKMTDVPGHTRGLVPLLAAAGVELLHVGANPVATVPDVPPAFRWRSPDGSEVVVVQQSGYGELTGVAGCPDHLSFARTGDNQGPPTVDEVLATFADLRARVPGAEVRGSTLDAFAEALRPVRAGLPVVTAEIGDTWIHGVGSDPQKVAALRELLRARRSWLAAGMVAPDDSRLRGFHEHLLLVAEHTWGLDEKTHLPDRERWSRDDLPALRAEDRTRAYEASWEEQRAHVDAAVGAIDSDGLRKAAAAALDVLRSPLPDWSRGAEVAAGARVRLGCWELVVDPATGALTHLVDRVSGRVLADADHPVGLLAHQAFDEADYARWWDGYVRSAPEDEWWAREDNLKPGIDAAGARAAWWEPDGATTWVGDRWSARAGLEALDGPVAEARPGPDDAADVGAGLRRARGPSAADLLASVGSAPGPRPGPVDVRALVVDLALPAEAHERSGAPAAAVLTLTDVSPPEGPSTLRLDLRWDEKPANRLPEATWVGVRPVVAGPDAMVLDKLGQDVSPLDVVAGGGRHLHAVGEGVRWPGPEGTVALRTLDAPLVAPGRPSLLDPDPAPLDLAGGAWVCLHDNVWGTNFPMWSEGRARFRFDLSWMPADPG